LLVLLGCLLGGESFAVTDAVAVAPVGEIFAALDLHGVLCR
jgi:hypothetical protein